MILTSGDRLALKRMVFHNLDALERYGSKANVQLKLTAICFRNCSEMDGTVLEAMLRKMLRASDTVYHEKSKFILLLPATNKEEAKHVFEDFKHHVCGEEAYCFNAYPDDAMGPEDFFDILDSKLDKEYVWCLLLHQTLQPF